MDDSEIRRQLGELHPESFGWALSCCAGNQQEAEDVLQAAYVKVLSGKARFAGRSSFRTWLFSVIRLTAADRRRRYAIRRGLLERWWQTEPDARADGEPAADETLSRRRVGQRLRAALARLPRRQQEALQLVFYHDHTLSEAAEVMGISLGSARTHYHRGKQALRNGLQEHDLDV